MMSVRREHLRAAAVALVVAVGLAAYGASSGAARPRTHPGGRTAAATVPIGVDLTFNNTAFWAAYVNYENQYAKQMHIKLLGPDIAGASASKQNQQIEELINEGAKSVIFNPETATSMGPAIAYANAHHVKLISVDTIVGVGKVYMVVRASNTLYGQDACAEIASKVKSGTVVDLEGDLTSSNGADRTNAFNACMKKNDPGVNIISDPTVWDAATAVTDAQNAINAHAGDLKAIYSQWSSPDTGIIPILKQKGLLGKVLMVSDDGVPFEMCDISQGSLTASQSQPANLYAKYALTYALDAAKGVKLHAGEAGGGAPKLMTVSYHGDKNLADPIVAPFVTKTAKKLTVAHAVDGLPASSSTTAVGNKALWGNVYGKAHGGVCAGAQ
jgi:ABC-type sugar transport system substrate-binding protein